MHLENKMSHVRTVSSSRSVASATSRSSRRSTSSSGSKSALAAEIARIEAEIERKRLEQEIKRMEEAIAKKNQEISTGTKSQQVVQTSRIQTQSWEHENGEEELVFEEEVVDQESGFIEEHKIEPVRAKKPDRIDDKERKRLKLEEDIRAMEASIAAKSMNRSSFKKTKSPVRRSVFLQSVKAASSEFVKDENSDREMVGRSSLNHDDSFRRSIAKVQQDEAYRKRMPETISENKEQVQPRSKQTNNHRTRPSRKQRAPVRRSIFLASVKQAATERDTSTEFVLNAVPQRSSQFNENSQQLDAKEIERQRLEQEIKRMEAEIASKQARRVSSSNSVSSNSIGSSSGRASFLASVTQAVTAREERLCVEPKVVSGSDVDRQRLAAEIRMMEAQIQSAELKKRSSETEATELSTDTERSPASTPGPPSFLSFIGDAAAAREQRVQEGNMTMREVQPETAEQKTTTPQLSFSLAEMVTKKAQDREKRLEAGGEKKMTKIKEKDEYKKDFSNIVIEAASMGRLTRLNEHVVEAIAKEKTPEEEWRSQGLLAIQWRSNHMAIIHEAAAYGAQIKMREKIVSNFPEEEEDLDFLDDKVSPRMRQLIELNSQAGTGQHKVDKLVMGRKEEKAGGESLLVHPMVMYNKIEDIELPKPLPPSIDVKKHKEKLKAIEEEAMRNNLPMKDISSAVAEVVWERRARLNRPGSMPKMKEKCDCPYCKTASPYQTFAYREIEKRHKHELKHYFELKEAEHRAKQEKQKLGALPTVAEDDLPAETPPPKVQEKAMKQAAGEKLKKKLAQSKHQPADKTPKPPTNTPLPAQNAIAVEPTVVPQPPIRPVTVKTEEPLNATNQCCACIIL